MLSRNSLGFCLIVYLYQFFELSEQLVTCGYKQCPHTKEGTLNVHLIPHSHMDAGWIKSFDEYYYGTRMNTSSANVQLIYHSVLTELQNDKRRKFILSETAYFWKWWKEQTPVMRNLFRKLVQDGRIEFVGGGWTQNDEATTHYQSIIDQFTWGLRKLNDTLGKCGRPRAAWQIDSYGHSREMASILSQIGFDGLFLGRMDYRMREELLDNGNMEMIWRGSDMLPKVTDLFASVMHNLYNAPEGFCFDTMCSDETVMDIIDSPIYNANKRVDEFIEVMEKQGRLYDFENILVPMGGDFTYQNAANWFTNMDKLIAITNSRQRNNSDINVFYSTPSCYLKSIYLEGKKDKTLITMKRDMFPYGSDLQTYWTGFYTSRPTLKYMERVGNNLLQVAKQISVLSRSPDTYELHQLRNVMGIFQHHDAITGTCQDHVAKDYARMMSQAMTVCSSKVAEFLGNMMTNGSRERRQQFYQTPIKTCLMLNISECRVSEISENFVVTVYNPISVPVTHYVRLPVLGSHYVVKDSKEQEIQTQLVPLPASIVNMPGRTSKASQELVFAAERIPGLGYSSYYVSVGNLDIYEMNDAYYRTKKNSKPVISSEDTSLSISNKNIKVNINQETGLLKSIATEELSLDVSQNFFYYTPSQSVGNYQTSGAYSFKPLNDIPFEVTETVSYRTIKGPLVEEIHQHYCNWITQVIRLYRDEEHVEFEWIIGPIPLGSDLGKEVVTRYMANLTTNGVFYTDSNGRQLMKRTVWSGTKGEVPNRSISSNFYPVPARVTIRDYNRSTEMAVLTDRPQGGTSLEDGEIELMIHRRLLTDDGFGVDEPLNEEAHGVGTVVKGQHFVMMSDYTTRDEDGRTFENRQRELARKKHLRPWIFLGDAETLTRRKWIAAKNKEYSALLPSADLPANLHVLTLEPWKADTVLLRLENTLENMDEPRNHRFPVKAKATKRRSKDKNSEEEYFSTTEQSDALISVDLLKMFNFGIRSIRETTLGGNQWLRDARRIDWSSRFLYEGGDDGLTLEDTEDYNTVKESINAFRAPAPPPPLSDISNKNIAQSSLLNNLNKRSKKQHRTKKQERRFTNRRKRDINIDQEISSYDLNLTEDDDRVTETTDFDDEDLEKLLETYDKLYNKINQRKLQNGVPKILNYYEHNTKYHLNGTNPKSSYEYSDFDHNFERKNKRMMLNLWEFIDTMKIKPENRSSDEEMLLVDDYFEMDELEFKDIAGEVTDIQLPSLFYATNDANITDWDDDGITKPIIQLYYGKEVVSTNNNDKYKQSAKTEKRSSFGGINQDIAGVNSESKLDFDSNATPKPKKHLVEKKRRYNYDGKERTKKHKFNNILKDRSKNKYSSNRNRNNNTNKHSRLMTYTNRLESDLHKPKKDQMNRFTQKLSRTKRISRTRRSPADEELVALQDSNRAGEKRLHQSETIKMSTPSNSKREFIVTLRPTQIRTFVLYLE